MDSGTPAPGGGSLQPTIGETDPRFTHSLLIDLEDLLYRAGYRRSGTDEDAGRWIPMAWSMVCAFEGATTAGEVLPGGGMISGSM